MDKKYSKPIWSKILGKILDFKIITSKPRSIKHIELANKVGLLVIMDNGMRFILAHNIDNDYSNFSIITEEDINKEVIPLLNFPK